MFSDEKLQLVTAKHHWSVFAGWHFLLVIFLSFMNELTDGNGVTVFKY